MHNERVCACAWYVFSFIFFFYYQRYVYIYVNRGITNAVLYFIRTRMLCTQTGQVQSSVALFVRVRNTHTEYSDIFFSFGPVLFALCGILMVPQAIPSCFNPFIPWRSLFRLVFAHAGPKMCRWWTKDVIRTRALAEEYTIYYCRQ